MAEQLYFDYTADLPGTIRLHGTVDRATWEASKFVRTPLEAAWAFVRGLLNDHGKWKCIIRINGGEHQKTIEVRECEGTVFRMDKPARATGETP